MTPVEYYTKNKKVYHYTPTYQEKIELDKQRMRQFYGRLKAEREKEEHEALIHGKGYCPKCFLLRPLTGICPTCD